MAGNRSGRSPRGFHDTVLPVAAEGGWRSVGHAAECEGSRPLARCPLRQAEILSLPPEMADGCPDGGRGPCHRSFRWKEGALLDRSLPERSAETIMLLACRPHNRH